MMAISFWISSSDISANFAIKVLYQEIRSTTGNIDVFANQIAEFTRAMKSSALKSMSSLRADNLAAK